MKVIKKIFSIIFIIMFASVIMSQTCMAEGSYSSVVEIAAKTNGTGESDKKLKNKNISEIEKWLRKNDPKKLSDSVRKNWTKKIEKAIESNDKDKKTAGLYSQARLEGKNSVEADKIAAGKEISIYQQPQNEGSNSGDEQVGVDDILSDSENFVENGDASVINQNRLENISGTFYNIFFTVGVAVAVITGMVIGIKYMTGSVEEKANYKQRLVPYLIGCIVVFGGFGIWKLIVSIVSAI